METVYDSTERYDPKINTWTPVAPMNVPRRNLAVVEFNGMLYAFGGRGASLGWGLCEIFDSVERYDPSNDTWTVVSRMSVPRAWHSAAVADGKIYAIGGITESSENPFRSGDGSPCNTVDRYDPIHNKWELIKNMDSSRRMYHASAAL